jgi:hypothetical protein
MPKVNHLMIEQKSFAHAGVSTCARLKNKGTITLVGWVLPSLVLQGCMALQVRRPLPEHLLDQAQVAAFFTPSGEGG